MRTKLKILMCALFVLGLTASQAQAQTRSFTLGTTHREAAQYGRNQMVGVVVLQHVVDSAADTDIAIPDNGKIDVAFGGLVITNGSVAPLCAAVTQTGFLNEDGTANIINFTTAGCAGGENEVTAVIAEDKKKLTITTPAGLPVNVILSGIRLDVSGLDVDAPVMARVSSSGAGGVNFGGGAGLSAARHIATVKPGIIIDVTHANQLYCSVTGSSMPSLKVGEGFDSAWEWDPDGFGSTMVKLKILNVPSGVTFIWPGQEHADAVMSNPTRTKDLRAADPERDETSKLDSLVATLEFVAAGLSSDTTEAIYEFVAKDYEDNDLLTDAAGGPMADNAEMHMNRTDTFELKLVVAVDAAKAGAGGTADIWGWLHPEPGFDDLSSDLSYKMVAQTEDTDEDGDVDEDDGDFLTVTECVTYLLYPFVSCGSTGGWSTGISVANTTMDDDVFGEDGGAAIQGGAVTLYGYPKSEKATDGSSGEAMDPVMAMISPNLAAGDTIAVSCPMVVEGGWEGYAIVKAGFRHAHGLAFLMGDFPDGAAVDVTHGYIALVIPDPQFNKGERGTELSESLGQ